MDTRLLQTVMVTGLTGVVSFLASWDAVADSYLADRGAVVSGGTELLARTRKREDLQTLYLERMNGDSPQIVRRFEGGLSRVIAAPRGALIGVLEVYGEGNTSSERATSTNLQYDRNGELVEAYRKIDSRLVILDVNGAIIHSVAGVYRFAWDSQGEHIAFVSGTYSEDGLGFQSTGTWLLEVSTRQAMKIFSGGVDVQWAKWDGNVYIETGEDQSDQASTVMRFDPRSRELSTTRRKGIYFSPDGRYYFRAGGEGDESGTVFRSDDDAEVSLNRTFIARERSWRAGADGWFGASTLIVRSPVPGEEATDYLYDIDSGQRRHADGRVIPMGDRRDVVLIGKGQSFSERGVNTIVTE